MATAATLEPEEQPKDGVQGVLPDASRARASQAVAASLRGHLQVAAPTHAQLVEDTLVEAMQSKKKGWGHCKTCNAHVAVEVLDASAAVNAAKALLEATEGKPATAGEVSQSPVIVRRVGQARS